MTTMTYDILNKPQMNSSPALEDVHTVLTKQELLAKYPKFSAKELNGAYTMGQFR